MRQVYFDEEEKCVLAMMNTASKETVQADLKQALPYLNDEDIKELVRSAMKKMDNLSEQGFQELLPELAWYREDSDMLQKEADAEKTGEDVC